MSKPGNLQDAIRQAVLEKRLAPTWTTGELLKDATLSQQFAKTTLRTAPPNASASPCGSVTGAGVLPGRLSPFIRLQGTAGGPLRYCLREHYSENDAPATVPATLAAGKFSKTRIVRANPVAATPLPALRTPAHTYEEFLVAFKPLIDHAHKTVESETLCGKHGWLSQLHGYTWSKDAGWKAGVEARQGNANCVATYLTGGILPEDAFKRIVNDWGGITQLLDASWDEPIRSSMFKLKDEDVQLGIKDKAGVCARRIASLSKLYAAMDLDRWVIYDSRVAAAITFLIHHGSLRARFAGCFGTLKAKNPRTLRALPGFRLLGTCYPGTQGHSLALQSFVYASWLCRAIATRLNQTSQDEFQWSAYHVEMVLFMLGADLKPLLAVPPAAQKNSVAVEF